LPFEHIHRGVEQVAEPIDTMLDGFDPLLAQLGGKRRVVRSPAVKGLPIDADLLSGIRHRQSLKHRVDRGELPVF
jgi:hypothetical protein